MPYMLWCHSPTSSKLKCSLKKKKVANLPVFCASTSGFGFNAKQKLKRGRERPFLSLERDVERADCEGLHSVPVQSFRSTEFAGRKSFDSRFSQKQKS